MSETHVAPQPGAPEQAHRLLPFGTFGTYLLLGALFCLLATLGFGWLARGVLADQFVRFDDGLITLLHGYWSPALNQLMLLFTTLGDVAVLAPLLVFVGAALLRLRRWIDAFGLALAGGGAGLLNQLLKAIFQRVRPDLFDGPLHLSSYSFPSGHSMGSIACYGMLAYIGMQLLHKRGSRLALGLAAALLVLGVGTSRVYFGVHYPTDVIGGFLAGAIWLALTIVLVQAAEWHARRRSSTLPAAAPDR